MRAFSWAYRPARLLLIICLTVTALSIAVQPVPPAAAAPLDLLVASFNTDEVLRYDGVTGAFVGAFVTAGLGGLDGPRGMTIRGNELFISSFIGDQVLRYDLTTGAFLGVFASGGGLDGPYDLAFGPDGNLYVANFFGASVPTGNPYIIRFDSTGALLGQFAPPVGTACPPDCFMFPDRPTGIAFGPDGRLYVSSYFNDSVKVYNATTGAYEGEFVGPGSGGLSRPEDIIWVGSTLYVASYNSGQVLTYSNTGTFLGVAATLTWPTGLLAGPDGRIYLAQGAPTNAVRRLPADPPDPFVPPDSGGLGQPWGMVFGAPSVAQPTLSKAFASSPVGVNTPVTLTFTIQNPALNPAQSGLAFTDTLPAGLVVATPNGLSATCAGTVTATSGTGTISLAGGSIGAGPASCTISVNVTAAAPDTYANTAANVVTTTLDTTGLSATLVVTRPTLSNKAFGAASIAVGATTTLTFTIDNTGGAAQSGIGFVDTLPVGLIYTSLNTTTCPSGSISGAGTPVITFSSVNVLANSTCTITLNVQGTAAGTYTNSQANILAPVNIGVGTFSTTLNVVAPTLTKAFAPASIPLGDTSTLTFTITNGAGNPAQGPFGFTDTLPGAPAGIAFTGTPTTTCGAGTVSIGGGGASLTLSNGTLSAGQPSCTVTATVDSFQTGTYVNDAAQVSGITGGLVNNVNATLTVFAPTLTKAFAPTAIVVGGPPSTLTFTIANSAGNPAQGPFGFTDTLPGAPAGIAFTGTPTTTCGAGTVSIGGGGASLTLSNGTLSPGQPSCTITATVQGFVAGAYVNDAAQVSGITGGLVNNVNATLTVNDGATLTKAFAPTAIGVGQVSTLTFTIQNAAGNPAQSGMGFTDTLPAGVVVATPNGLANTCGGTVTAISGTGTIVLAGGALGAGTPSCTISVDVTSGAAGSYLNATANGNITGLAGGLTATGLSATLTVDSGTLSKAFAPTQIGIDGVSTLTFTVTNAAGNPLLTGLAFTDTLPAGVVVAPAPNVVNTCGGTVTATAGSGTIALAGGTLAAGTPSCTLAVDVTSSAPGTYDNTAANISGLSANLSAAGLSATLEVLPAGLSKSFSPAVASIDDPVTVLTFTIQNSAGNPAQSDLGFTETLPAGLTVDAPPTVTNTCGGVLTVIAGGDTITLTGGALAAGTPDCTITVSIRAAAEGAYINSAANISGLTGGLQLGNVNATFVVTGAAVAPVPTLLPAIPCADLDGTTNAIIRATVPAGTVTGGSVFCRVLAENRQIVTRPGEIGTGAILDRDFIQVVDVFGLLWGGQSQPRFNNPATICLQGTGVFLYADATAAPRVVSELPAFTQGGYTCANIPNAGTVALVSGVPGVRAPVPATGLATCSVTTLNMLNLRAEPDPTSAVLTIVPYNVTLRATGRSGDWFRVDYAGQTGWLSGRFVSTEGICN